VRCLGPDKIYVLFEQLLFFHTYFYEAELVAIKRVGIGWNGAVGACLVRADCVERESRRATIMLAAYRNRFNAAATLRSTLDRKQRDRDDAELARWCLDFGRMDNRPLHERDETVAMEGITELLFTRGAVAPAKILKRLFGNCAEWLAVELPFCGRNLTPSTYSAAAPCSLLMQLLYTHYRSTVAPSVMSSGSAAAVLPDIIGALYCFTPPYPFEDVGKGRACHGHGCHNVYAYRALYDFVLIAITVEACLPQGEQKSDVSLLPSVGRCFNTRILPSLSTWTACWSSDPEEQTRLTDTRSRIHRRFLFESQMTVLCLLHERTPDRPERILTRRTVNVITGRLDIFAWMSQRMPTALVAPQGGQVLLNAFCANKHTRRFLVACLQCPIVRKTLLIHNPDIFADLIRRRERRLVKFLWRCEPTLFNSATVPASLTLSTSSTSSSSSSCFSSSSSSSALPEDRKESKSECTTSIGLIKDSARLVHVMRELAAECLTSQRRLVSRGTQKPWSWCKLPTTTSIATLSVTDCDMNAIPPP
jgi:hypothetical protein